MIKEYFPEITAQQHEQFQKLLELYRNWNSKINVVSRKDIINLEIHHLLFSLGIAKAFSFASGTKIMDAGTGGGLPGIPLAIYFPEVQFTLVDSIGKKIKVVENISKELGLKNVIALQVRAEQVQSEFHFITGRAVSDLPGFVNRVRTKLLPQQINSFANGIIYLKGGEVEDELGKIEGSIRVFPLSDFFRESFFETKKLIYLSNLSS